MDITEQHLQLLATGHPILKPVYDHDTGKLARPELVVPKEFVVIEGLLPLHTKLECACFDVTVYLNPPEEIRREWKIKRDTAQRGYTREQVLAELDRREPESEAIHPPAAPARRHRGPVRPGPGPARSPGHRAVRRTAAPADDPAPEPERRCWPTPAGRCT